MLQRQHRAGRDHLGKPAQKLFSVFVKYLDAALTEEQHGMLVSSVRPCVPAARKKQPVRRQANPGAARNVEHLVEPM